MLVYTFIYLYLKISENLLFFERHFEETKTNRRYWLFYTNNLIARVKFPSLCVVYLTIATPIDMNARRRIKNSCESKHYTK